MELVHSKRLGQDHLCDVLRPRITQVIIVAAQAMNANRRICLEEALQEGHEDLKAIGVHLCATDVNVKIPASAIWFLGILQLLSDFIIERVRKELAQFLSRQLPRLQI